MSQGQFGRVGQHSVFTSAAASDSLPLARAAPGSTEEGALALAGYSPFVGGSGGRSSDAPSVATAKGTSKNALRRQQTVEQSTI